MSDQVLVAIVSTMGGVTIALLGVIAAYLEKNRRDTNRIRQQTHDVYQSINNRNEPLSDRIDRLATKSDVRRLERKMRRRDDALSDRINIIETKGQASG